MMIFIIAGGLLLVSLLTYLLFKHIGLYHKFKKMSKQYEEQIDRLSESHDKQLELIRKQNELINGLCDQIEGKESEWFE